MFVSRSNPCTYEISQPNWFNTYISKWGQPSSSSCTTWKQHPTTAGNSEVDHHSLLGPQEGQDDQPGTHVGLGKWNQLRNRKVDAHNTGSCDVCVSLLLTVDGKNPAPLRMPEMFVYYIPIIYIRASQAVQDFFHQPYGYISNAKGVFDWDSCCTLVPPSFVSELSIRIKKRRGTPYQQEWLDPWGFWFQVDP